MKSLLLAFGVVGLLLSVPDVAKACGGCFAPPTGSTQVTAHRMAFAVSNKRAILWDQIQYVGSPSDFGWVLPIAKKVEVGVSSDAFFERIDGTTAVRVSPPPRPMCPATCRTVCNDRFGSVDAGSASDTATSGDVTVWGTEVVGPYEATQLAASDVDALRTWLKDHGYVLPTTIEPVIEQYIKGGFGFLAIKLVPGAGVSRMVPIRIAYDGMNTTLPLRMIAAGAGLNVGIKLFVLGSGRWQAKNFPNEAIPNSSLVWNFPTMSSNFFQLEQDAIKARGGELFVTETSDEFSKSWLTTGLPPDKTTTEAGTFFASATDDAELDKAFPDSSTVQITRLFAELGQAQLGRDLELEASSDGKIPAARQAPNSVGGGCIPNVIECPSSPKCPPGAYGDAGVGDSGVGDDGGITGLGDDATAGGGGCVFHGGKPATTFLVVAGAAMGTAFRRRRKR